MTRVSGIAVIVACASCGKLLGNDEDPSPPEPPVVVNDGGDATSADAPAGDASGRSDGAACKPPRAGCTSVGECCAGTLCNGTCCIEDNQPATSPAECCLNKKMLVACDPPLTGMCCADFV